MTDTVTQSDVKRAFVPLHVNDILVDEKLDPSFFILNNDTWVTAPLAGTNRRITVVVTTNLYGQVEAIMGVGNERNEQVNQRTVICVDPSEETLSLVLRAVVTVARVNSEL